MYVYIGYQAEHGIIGSAVGVRVILSRRSWYILGRVGKGFQVR